MGNKSTAGSNESVVYSTIKKIQGNATVSEIAALIPSLTERTVRRCIYALKEQGMIREYGKQNNAVVYGVADKSMYETEMSLSEEIPIVPFGGNLLKVSEFLEAMISMEENPLTHNKDLPLIRERMLNGIRRLMIGVVMTSGVAGQEGYLEKSHEGLQKVEDELKYLLKIVSGFNHSGVWFDQYRDRVAFQTRRAQQQSPETWEVAINFMRSE